MHKVTECMHSGALLWYIDPTELLTVVHNGSYKPLHALQLNAEDLASAAAGCRACVQDLAETGWC